MKELEKIEQYHINIVDCSLGVGIPAVGVVITTEDKSEYQFHMGVDPSPISALERSLTELFQGRDAIKFKQFDEDFQKQLNDDVKLKESEIQKTYCASTGAYPMAFFSDIASYEFKGFNDRFGWSDESDLKMLTELIEQLGFNLYVRDNSILGFPAYSLYVPGMTELYNVFSLSNMEYGGISNWEKPNSAIYKEYTDIIRNLQGHALDSKIDQMSLQRIFC
jgi:ribosomal protein S12 methylthiotransferase accessory factor